MGLFDHHAVASYEQRHSDALAGNSMFLRADGQFDRRGMVGRTELRLLAGPCRRCGLDDRVIEMPDLLGALQVQVDAELIMWQGIDGRGVASPVERILRDATTRLLLGGPDLDTDPDWGAPVVLMAPEWLMAESMPLRGLTAMSFSEFVGEHR
ncbi:MAG: hypothetical protein AB8G14_03835 [Ilumatobacter sp.]